MSLIELCTEGDLEGVKAALQSGADVNRKEEIGFTGLMQAVFNNRNSVVEILLETFSTILDDNMERESCWCALHLAVYSKNIRVLKLLLKVPTLDVNRVTNSGYSALHWAVRVNNIEGLKLLLDHRDIELLDNHGYSALHMAVEENKIEALKVILFHPRLTALTLNQKYRRYAASPVMFAAYMRIDQKFWHCWPLTLGSTLKLLIGRGGVWRK